MQHLESLDRGGNLAEVTQSLAIRCIEFDPLAESGMLSDG